MKFHKILNAWQNNIGETAAIVIKGMGITTKTS